MLCSGCCEHLPVASFSPLHLLIPCGFDKCCKTIFVQAAEFSGSCELDIHSEEMTASGSSLPGVAAGSEHQVPACSVLLRLQRREVNCPGSLNWETASTASLSSTNSNRDDSSLYALYYRDSKSRNHLPF